MQFLTIEDLIELSRRGMSHKVGRYADLLKQIECNQLI